MFSGILTDIQKMIPSLSKSEKRVAKAILDEPQQMMYLSLGEFGKKANVGDATVVRFCRKLQLSGYQELKLKIAQSVPESVEVAPDEAGDEIQEIFRITMETNEMCIRDTTVALDPEQVSRAAEMIVEAKKVSFIGIGGSALSAMDAFERFREIGIDCYSVSDPYFQLLDAKFLGPGDVAVGISYSGNKRSTIDVMKIAKERGARSIGILGRVHSPLAEHCDVVLCTSIRETPMLGGTFVTKIAQSHVLDLLCSVVIAKIAKRSGRSVEETIKSFVRQFY